MRRSILILLITFSLLSQWGWLEHAYHDHDPDDTCQFCLLVHAYDHAIISLPPLLPTVVYLRESLRDWHQTSAKNSPNHHTIRAPPALLYPLA